MKNMKKIAVVGIIILAGAFAYFGVQRYQNNHEQQSVKIQQKGLRCENDNDCPNGSCIDNKCPNQPSK